MNDLQSLSYSFLFVSWRVLAVVIIVSVITKKRPSALKSHCVTIPLVIVKTMVKVIFAVASTFFIPFGNLAETKLVESARLKSCRQFHSSIFAFAHRLKVHFTSLEIGFVKGQWTATYVELFQNHLGITAEGFWTMKKQIQLHLKWKLKKSLKKCTLCSWNTVSVEAQFQLKYNFSWNTVLVQAQFQLKPSFSSQLQLRPNFSITYLVNVSTETQKKCLSWKP